MTHPDPLAAQEARADVIRLALENDAMGGTPQTRAPSDSKTLEALWQLIANLTPNEKLYAIQHALRDVGMCAVNEGDVYASDDEVEDAALRNYALVRGFTLTRVHLRSEEQISAAQEAREPRGQTVEPVKSK